MFPGKLNRKIKKTELQTQNQLTPRFKQGAAQPTAEFIK